MTGDRSRRIQFDLSADYLRFLEILESRMAVRSRADLLQQAIGTLFWVVQETLRGRKVVSISADEIDRLSHVVELMTPTFVLSDPGRYEHLVARPHSWRRQLSLKGRNMTVGQLVATMRASELSPEAAADDLDVPLAQIREALDYYRAHRDLVDSELREERSRLQEKGYAIEPSALSR